MKSLRRLAATSLALIALNSFSVYSPAKQVNVNSREYYSQKERNKESGNKRYEEPTKLEYTINLTEIDIKNKYELRFRCFADDKKKEIFIPEWPYPSWSVKIGKEGILGQYKITIDIPEETQKRLIREYLENSGKDSNHTASPLVDNLDIVKENYPINGCKSTITWEDNERLRMIIDFPKDYHKGLGRLYEQVFKSKLDF